MVRKVDCFNGPMKYCVPTKSSPCPGVQTAALNKSVEVFKREKWRWTESGYIKRASTRHADPSCITAASRSTPTHIFTVSLSKGYGQAGSKICSSARSNRALHGIRGLVSYGRLLRHFPTFYGQSLSSDYRRRSEKR